VTTILILGGGVMQFPAITIAKRRGWRVVVADGNPRALARGMCDIFEPVDLKDKEGMLGLARRISSDVGLDGVFTAGTDFSATVAWVAERMGLPGIGWETARRATDKVLMRQAFDSKGVPSPRYSLWTGNTDPVSAGESIGFPLVVKPVDNMGARGVTRVDEAAEVRPACDKAMGMSRSGRVIIEKYMEGPELSLDAVVYRGEITVCGVADRHICFPPFFVEMGHTMPTTLDASMVRKVEGVFRAGIQAIGIDMGAAKGDIKLTPEGPMVGEIAARLSGGYMSGWTFPLSAGVEVTEAALMIAVGLHPGDLAPRIRRVSAERAIISIPGKISAICGVEDARGVSGIHEVFIRVVPGMDVVFPTNNVEKCGNVISSTESRAHAISAAEKAAAMIQLSLEPMNETTDIFLFSDASDADGLNAYGRKAPKSEPYYGDPASMKHEAAIPVLSTDGFEQLTDRDWHGLPMSAAVSRMVESGRVRLVSGKTDEDFVLYGVFWRAMIRGGMQGAMYLIDSLEAASKNNSVSEYLSRICGR
jgi:biotin carboxylase